jgi:2'-5' RNA ligase
MVRYRKLLAAFGICAGPLLGCAEETRAEQKSITAINIALDPGAAMVRYAEAANARLLKDYPQGFALDATHRPHITLLQRFVSTENLGNIYVAVGKVLTDVEVGGWKLKASNYYYTPWKDKGVGIIAVEPAAVLLKLQQKLIDAVAPFTVETGTAEAFFTTPDDSHINPTTIDYVAAFIPNQSGKNFHPHVTLGIASQDYVKEIAAEPFEAFTFSPAGVSVYQLGNFGTARKKLKEWKANP